MGGFFEHFGWILGGFREHLGRILGGFREHLERILGGTWLAVCSWFACFLLLVSFGFAYVLLPAGRFFVPFVCSLVSLFLPLCSRVPCVPFLLRASLSHATGERFGEHFAILAFAVLLVCSAPLRRFSVRACPYRFRLFGPTSSQVDTKIDAKTVINSKWRVIALIQQNKGSGKDSGGSGHPFLEATSIKNQSKTERRLGS